MTTYNPLDRRSALHDGYCEGTLGVPNAIEHCPVCDFYAGLTEDSLVGYHVQEPGPRPLAINCWTVQAHNTKVPGLMVISVDGVSWYVAHAMSSMLVQEERFKLSLTKAQSVAGQLGLLCGWLEDPTTQQTDGMLGFIVRSAFSLAWREEQTST